MPFKVFVVSDSTGETAWRVVGSALRQFSDVECEIIRISDVRNKSDLQATLKKLAGYLHADESLVVYTFADQRLRELMAGALTGSEIRGIDLIGPVIGELQDLFSTKPSQTPGIQYRQDEKYDARMLAIEYTVKHDDGLGVSTLAEADIVLVGPSRTGKTPLSMYLALNGYRVANVPLFAGLPLPPVLEQNLQATVIGLTIAPDSLLKFRKERVRKTGADQKSSGYAAKDIVKDEIAAANALYEKHNWTVIDVTGKAIEEVAVEVLARVAPNIVGMG